MADAPRDHDDDPFDEARDTPDAGWIQRLRTQPGTREVYRLGVFLLGLAFIALGIALAVLPGPLTIPPVLLGLWIWSTEFAWADRQLERARARGRVAWADAQRRPVLSSVVTLGGLVALGVGIWAAGRFDLVARALELAGL